MPMVPGTELTNMFGPPWGEVTLSLKCWGYGTDGKPKDINLQLKEDGRRIQTRPVQQVGLKEGGEGQDQFQSRH